ncbi:MAG TPA: putative porin [Candidatus Binatia bacterium]|nr:putative porin [Candidatus Binatia bacterium]
MIIVRLLLIALLAAPAAAETPLERRLRQLEDAVRRQQQEIERLRAELRQQKAAGEAAENRAEEAQRQATATAATVEQAKPWFNPPDWLRKVSLFGDLRYRQEGFYHQPHRQGQEVTARNRERIRGRLGLRFAYSDELSATFRSATGDPNDPISTNDTLTGVFARKHVNLDWAYLTFTPGKTFDLRPGVLSITAGKFPNPIFRTDEMVFDEDLALEGLTQTVEVLGRPHGPLDQVRVRALEWTFAEVADKEDGWMLGGQVNPSLHFGTVLFEAGLGQYWWLNPDLIAQALSRNTTAFTASGAPVANSAFNPALANTNRLMTASIQPPTTTPGKTPPPFTAITGYKSGFNQTNLTLAATVPDVVRARPLRLWLDYVYNWEAAGPPSGWTAGLRLGETSARGDWALTGFYEHLGQEAAISSFTWSEFGTGATNVEGPGVGVDYQPLDPFTLSARSFFTNFINRPTGSTNPTLTRFQLDALVRF